MADPELLGGDHPIDTFEEAFKRYYGAVVRFFRRMQVSDPDGEELAQETFKKAFEQWPIIRRFDRARLEKWIFIVARNEFLMRYRQERAKKRSGVVAGLEGPGEGPAGRVWADAQGIAAGRPPDEALLEKERKERLHQALRSLPEQMRTCLIYRVRDDFTIKETARAMGIAEGTVKAHWHKGKKALEDALRPYFSDTEMLIRGEDDE